MFFIKIELILRKKAEKINRNEKYQGKPGIFRLMFSPITRQTYACDIMTKQGFRMSPFEIERKFLVRETPRNAETHSAVEVLQGYLAVSDDGTEVRLRNIDQAYILTVKSGKGIRRQERETVLSKEQFERLWPMTEGKRVEKIRYKIAMSGFTIELDIYQESLEGLKTAEVEFKTQDEAESFTPPSWLDKDVTLDERYKNKNLALNGLPEDFQQV